MKRILLLHFSFLILIFSSCSKKDTCEDPVDCLPPLTQTGENKVGCLINGKPFKPGGHQWGGPTLQAFYQNSNEGYHFGLGAINNRGDRNILVGIALRNTELVEGESYLLQADEEDSNFGEYMVGAESYQTNENVTGEILFTNFDDKNGIVSGTFWFDAVSREGDTVEIREGRFDVKYY